MGHAPEITMRNILTTATTALLLSPSFSTPADAFECRVECTGGKRTRSVACSDRGSAVHQAWKLETAQMQRSCTVRFTSHTWLFTQEGMDSCGPVQDLVVQEFPHLAGALPELGSARKVADDQTRRSIHAAVTEDPSAWSLVERRAIDVMEEVSVRRQELEVLRVGAHALSNAPSCSTDTESVNALLEPLDRLDSELLVLLEEAQLLKRQATQRLDSLAAAQDPLSSPVMHSTVIVAAGSR